MKKIVRYSLCFVALLLALAQPLSVKAIEIDVDAPCSITLYYSQDNIPFADMEVSIFRVADMESDGNYTPTDTFAKYPVKIHGIQSQKEWRESTLAMVSYVQGDNLTPMATGYTDEAGMVVFENLPTGMYLLMEAETWIGEKRLQFQPLFVFLPSLEDAGVYDYHLRIHPKQNVGMTIERYQVVKLWKDSANQKARPESIAVDILKDGILAETVILSQENDWSYSWLSADLDSRWSVMEKDVPAGYTVAISQQEGNFVITNTYPPRPEDVPQTGDIISPRN